MQVVIALPRTEEMDKLDAPVCGVPLLVRVIATALRCGGSRVLLLLPPGWSRPWLARRLRSREIGCACVEALDIEQVFDSCNQEAWRAIAYFLDDRFLWMPYDFVAHRKELAGLAEAAARHAGAAVRFPGFESGSGERIFEQPAILLRRNLCDGTMPAFQVCEGTGQPGIRFGASATLGQVEAELVRHSGKATDGIYSRFNRKLCRPAVRWLSHTKVTPNAVTFGGLAVAILAGICFARGSWAWDVAGAALFFISGLFDEIDGMLARLKFRDSPFGCWLESMVDYSTYLLIFAGMTIGGYHRSGPPYLVLGAAIVLGCVLSFIVISEQRRLAAPADKPNEYSQRYLVALERDSGNAISRLVRQLQFLTKKGVLVHYLLVFALLGLLPVVMVLCAVGANVAWVVTLYLNRRLFLPKEPANRRRATLCPTPSEVEK